ncbi:MAG: AAA family ATPase [Bacteroidales bacterium]|nr:AAA family ATPase [Bacteroidales bacterium]
MEYVKRKIDEDLLEWKKYNSHKPLLLRGARQIGKSSSIREFGKQFEYFLEINFERKEHQAAKKIFENSSSPKTITDELYAMFGVPIEKGKTLLFLDEIQSCIPAISSLRFFYEEMPELHVIAAGSLLEFALEELPSFGVGRISSMFMYPLSFSEYLGAVKMEKLAEAIRFATTAKPLSDVLHHEALKHLIKYIVIGGMPEVVATYAKGGSLRECMQILDDLVHTYYDDFAKYRKKVPALLLRKTLSSIVEQTGCKFNYSAISKGDRHEQLKQCVDLLCLAGLVYPLNKTSANGIPLGAEVNHKFRKFLIFDTGIMLHILGEDISDILLGDKLEQINKGDVAELFVGLELLKNSSMNTIKELYYWQRDERNSNAQIDYLIQKGSKIIPVEVKSGTTGKMQSLRLFMKEKKSEYGIRISLENFNEYDKIKVIPLYAIENILKL